MYENIGGKIKGSAIAVFIIGAVISIIAGIAALSGRENNGEINGIILLIVGPVAAWISSWSLYAFGELVENSQINAENTTEINNYIKMLKRKEHASYVQNNDTTVGGTKQENSSWICVCGYRAYDRFCSNCGRTKISVEAERAEELAKNEAKSAYVPKDPAAAARAAALAKKEDK